MKTYITWVLITLGVGLLIMAARDAAAAPCAERDKFVQYFDDKYEEDPKYMGLMADGRIIEILTSKSGSWTIIVTKPNGISCGLASGSAWMDSPIKSKLKGEAGS